MFTQHCARLATLTSLLGLGFVPAAQASTHIFVQLGVPPIVAPVPIAPVPVAPLVVPGAPYIGYVWQPGYYAWTAFGYRWVPGVWVRPSVVRRGWVPERFERGRYWRR